MSLVYFRRMIFGQIITKLNSNKFLIWTIIAFLIRFRQYFKVTKKIFTNECLLFSYNIIKAIFIIIDMSLMDIFNES